MQADSIKIECDENGFHMIVETPDLPRGRVNINIHSCAEALHEQVNLIIGGWLAEGRAARAEYEHGYALDDPHHPAFHSVHADLWDAREGK